MDPKKKFFLFKQSQNFCSVPWNMFKVDPDGTVNTCVPGTTRLGNIKEHSIHSIVNSPAMQAIRNNLLQDLPDPNCANCTKLENGEFGHLRKRYNQQFVDRDIDYADNSFTLSAVDLQWSSTCNLRCVMCWAKQSSAIAQQQRIPILTTRESEVEELTNWIVDQQYSLKEIYISGGEPTLIKHNLRLLQQLDKTNRLLLRVNTSLMFDRDNPVMQQVLEFPNVEITVSTDAIRAQFEYIRYGADYRKFLDTLLWLKTTHVQLRMNFVFFVATAAGLLDAVAEFRNYNIQDFTVNDVAAQPALQARNLPTAVKETLVKQYLEEIQRRPTDVAWVGQLSNCIAELQQPSNGISYATYFDDIDSRHGTDWRTTFPELT
jgi:radical SAM protein with 4Fe4S-binding SPASM domain